VRQLARLHACATSTPADSGDSPYHATLTHPAPPHSTSPHPTPSHPSSHPIPPHLTPPHPIAIPSHPILACVPQHPTLTPPHASYPANSIPVTSHPDPSRPIWHPQPTPPHPTPPHPIPPLPSHPDPHMRFATVTMAPVVVRERDSWLEGRDEPRGLDWAAARSRCRYGIIEWRRHARMCTAIHSPLLYHEGADVTLHAPVSPAQRWQPRQYALWSAS